MMAEFLLAAYVKHEAKGNQLTIPRSMDSAECHLHWTEHEHEHQLVSGIPLVADGEGFTVPRFHSKVRRTLMEKENTCNILASPVMERKRRAYACTCPASPARSLSLISSSRPRWNGEKC
jgi:hypothetical protein